MIVKVSIKKVKHLVKEGGFEWGNESRYSSKQTKDYSDSEYVEYYKFEYSEADPLPQKQKWSKEYVEFEEWLKTAPKELSYRVEYNHPTKCSHSDLEWHNKLECFVEEPFETKELYVKIHTATRGWYIEEVSPTGVFKLLKHEKFSKYGYTSLELEYPEENKDLFLEYLEKIEEDLVNVLGTPDNRYSVLDWSEE
jgi:hypothetical protein